MSTKAPAFSALGRFMQWPPALCCLGEGPIWCTTGEPLNIANRLVVLSVSVQFLGQVNLIPSDRPQDVYSEVAVLVRG